MGRRPLCEKEEVKTGAWTAEEDRILIDYVKAHGEGQWARLPKNAGLNRCGKSCRFRWLNYLRPDIKRGNISPDEEELILRLHKLLGNRWSLIAGRLPGRTDNEIKNYWNTILCKRARDESDSPKLKAPRKLRRHPDKSEGKSNLKLEENDSALGNPRNPVQPPLSEREPPVSLAAFWAATLKRSEVDINRQLSLRRDEDDDRCIGVNNGGPGPWPPLEGDVSVKSEVAKVEKDGAAIGSGGVEAGEIPAEDPVMDFDIGDICLSDLLNSELLVGSNSSSTLTPSDPRLAFSNQEPMVQDWKQHLCLFDCPEVE